MRAIRLVHPRFDTPPGTLDPASTDRLPRTLISEHVERLAVCAAVGAGLWTYGLLMDTIVRPATVGAAIPTVTVVVAIAAIAVSLIMFVYVRFAPHAAERKADAGLVYLVLNAAAVALINAATGFAAQSGGRGLSWNTVVNRTYTNM